MTTSLQAWQITKIRRNAKGKWKAILSTVMDGDVLDGSHHPCPLCGGTDRFRFDDKQGSGTYFCNGCGAGGGIELFALHQELDLDAAWRAVEAVIPTAVYEEPK